MCDVLEIDKKLIDKKREELNLPKPTEFGDEETKGRITPELIDRLMPLLQLPFDQSAIDINNKNGYTTKGVNWALQEARLQEVFGHSHIDIQHTITDEGSYTGSKDKELYYCKVLVTIRIGNYTFYIDSTNNQPKSSFVTYYKVTGVGFAKDSPTKGGAEKNAIANGKKECFRQMGMLRYLYLDEDDDNNSGDHNNNTSTIKLAEKPTFYSSGSMYLKGKAINSDNEKITIIVWKKDNANSDEHKKMIELLENHKDKLVEGKTLTVDYFVNEYNGEEQYVITKIHSNK